MCTYLPTIISSISLAFFLICLQMSMVKIVELLLNMEVREDMRADIITANIKPVIQRNVRSFEILYDLLQVV